MAGSGTPERRPAVWPSLVMALIVLAAFFLLTQVRRHPGAPALTGTPPAPAAPAPAGQ
jgi:hypothetical protein